MTERRNSPVDPLDEALAGLAPIAASPGFTQRVIAGLDSDEGRRHASPGRVWALAAVAVVAVAVGVFLGSRPEPPMAALAAERESLRLEHDELMRELDSLRSLAQETRPMLYLGSGDDVDFVLDLTRLAEPSLEQTSETVRPAALENPSDRPRYY